MGARTEPTLYDVLGVPPDATAEEIEKAWKRHLKYWHPDRNRLRDAEPRSKAINRAHDVLSDPSQRAAYDRELAREETAPPRPTSPPRRPSGAPRPKRQAAGGPSSAGSNRGQQSASPPPPPPSWTTPPPPAAAPAGRRATVRRLGAWLVDPLRGPITRQSIQPIALRSALVVGGASAIILLLPLIIEAVIWVVSLVAVAVLFVGALWVLAHSSPAPRKRRRAKRRR